MATNNNWYFTKKQVQKHFGDSKHEVLYRRSSATFIQEVGIKLKLPQLTIATAIAYFQRFFIRHHLKDHDRYIVSTACLFLAGKVEEAHRTLVDVINISYRIKNKINTPNYEMDKNELDDIKSKILVSEHQILTTIAFDLAVEHPYKCLLEYIKHTGGDKHLCQVAWNFVNDSLRTTLCLHYPPDLISYASVYLATKFLNLQLSPGEDKKWWEILDIKLEVLEDISKQILDLYEPVPALANKNNSTTTTTATATTGIVNGSSNSSSNVSSSTPTKTAVSSTSNGTNPEHKNTTETTQPTIKFESIKVDNNSILNKEGTSPSSGNIQKKSIHPPIGSGGSASSSSRYSPYKKETSSTITDPQNSNSTTDMEI